MKLFDRFRKGRAEARSSIETIAVSASPSDFFAFFGLEGSDLPAVTVDSAMTVPAFWCGVNFLSRTLAALPLHPYRKTQDGPRPIEGKWRTVIHEAPNDEQDSFKFRQYFWSQVFTHGRGLAWIERNASGSSVDAIWPMDASKVRVVRRNKRLVYIHEGQEYGASEIIDVPFLLKANQTQSFSPVKAGGKALQLAISMGDYGSRFFAGGGVPPLAMEGPVATGPEAIKRQMSEVYRVIEAAKRQDKPIFPLPPGYKLNPVGFDPDKGQMTDARRFQVEEIARVLQLPPAFLQDLTHGTFTNTEQQDLHLVKHLVAQWAQAFEGELNLKLFGRGSGTRYVEHNLDGLQRGDFQTRMEGLAKGVQNAVLTPNEARGLVNRPSLPDGDKLMIQGATVPLGTQPTNGGGVQ